MVFHLEVNQKKAKTRAIKAAMYLAWTQKSVRSMRMPKSAKVQKLRSKCRVLTKIKMMMRKNSTEKTQTGSLVTTRMHQQLFQKKRARLR